MENQKILNNEELKKVTGGSIGSGIAVGSSNNNEPPEKLPEGTVYREEQAAFPAGAILYRPGHDSVYDHEDRGSHKSK